MELKVEDIKPINNLILVVLPIEEEKTNKDVKTESGIIIDTGDNKQNQPQATIVKCEVVAVSDDVFQDLALEVGDFVLAHKFKGDAIVIDDKAHLLLDVKTEVYAILK